MSERRRSTVPGTLVVVGRALEVVVVGTVVVVVDVLVVVDVVDVVVVLKSQASEVSVRERATGNMQISQHYFSTYHDKLVVLGRTGQRLLRT